PRTYTHRVACSELSAHRLRHSPVISPSAAPVRDPHSFPTRRSSDLLASLNDLLWAEALLRQSAPNVATATTLIDKTRFGGATLQDRKSTRLNSSHSQISYAVFCLKKKTTDYRY